jgi:ERCC4-type nuclease
MVEKPLIVRDSREKTGWDFVEDDFFAGTIIEKIGAGDYGIKGLTHLLFLERKANTAELCKNITEDRFWGLLERAKNYKYKYMVIEATYDDFIKFPLNSGMPVWHQKHLKITSNFLISCLIRMSVEYGIHIVFAGSIDGAEHFTHALLKRFYKLEQHNVLKT